MTNSDDGLTWVTDDPLNSEPRNKGAQEIRSLRKGVALRMDKEHQALTIMSNGGPDLSTGGGEHKKGSAIIYRQEGAPDKRPDGETDLDADDNGRLWIKTSTGLMSVYVNPIWSAVTPTAVSADVNIATAIASPGGWNNDTGNLVLVMLELRFNAVSRQIKVDGTRMGLGVIIGNQRFFSGSLFVPNARVLETIPSGDLVDGTEARYQTIVVS